MTGAAVIRGDALRIPLADRSVHLIVTSPPYFALRSYRDGDEHYGGQIGSEAHPLDFLRALWAVTDECWRVLADDGSAWINLGDKYAGNTGDVRSKSLMGLPWRFAMGLICPDLYRAPFEPAACWHDDGPGPCRTCPPRRFPQWIGRAEVVWSKPNGLPESVTDRVRRSHEQWFHVTKAPYYFAGIDKIREAHMASTMERGGGRNGLRVKDETNPSGTIEEGRQGWEGGVNPLGKLPGSVWTVPSAPLSVPELWLSEDRRTWRHHGEPTRNAKRKAELRREVWELAEKQHANGENLYVKQVDHFACVDAATEILTTRGWLRYDQLTEGDTVAGYNLDLGRAEWTGCHGIHRYDYDGPLVAVEKRGLSMRLTPNHRVLAEKRHGRSGHRGPMTVVRADELVPGHFIPQAAEWQPFEHKSVGTSIAALLGWVAAEGWYQETGDVHLSQSLSVNSEHVTEIDKLLASLPAVADSEQRGVSFEQNMYRARLQVDGKRITIGHFGTNAEAVAAIRAERDRRGLDAARRTEAVCVYRGREWVDVKWRLPRGLGQDVRRLMPHKLLTWDMVGLPENERRTLLNAFIDGDGHRRPDGRIGIYQKLRQNLDVLQAIAVTLGYRTRLTEGGGRFVLYLTTGDRSVTLRGTNGRLDPIPTEHYRGTVWCPTTGTGTFIARRNGKVFVTGNSFPAEWPRRIIAGWSPTGICTACGQGRRPVVSKTLRLSQDSHGGRHRRDYMPGKGGPDHHVPGYHEATITGYACACPDNSAPTRPSVILDPFGGTGTTAMMARAMGRFGVQLDLSRDYNTLARWRIFESGHGERVLAKAAVRRVSSGPERKRGTRRGPVVQLQFLSAGTAGG